MGRRSVWFSWCASVGLVLGASAGSAWAEPRRIDQRALEQPEAVVAWLDEYAATADRRMAQRYFSMGVARQKEQGNWSAASKAFGESALLFPAPAAIAAHADNRLRDLAGVRSREKDTSRDRAHADLTYGLALYRSALAAERRLKMLSAEALAQLRSDESCLSAYLATPSETARETCRPLTLYAAERR